MPGGSLSGALPIGILMFLGTLFAYLQRRAGRKRAAQTFPALARRFGLEYTPPRYKGAVGLLTGKFENRAIRVDPDDQRLIKVRFRGAPAVDLRSYEHAMRAPFDMVSFRSGDREFDRFFKTRFASEEIAARIARSDTPSRHLDPFIGRYSRHVQALTITGDGVVCRLDFGTPPYIPDHALEDLLPACAALAELIEPTLEPTLPSVSGDALDAAK